MRVNTKYQVGDLVYFAKDANKVAYEIDEIGVNYTRRGVFKYYDVNSLTGGEDVAMVQESELCLLALRGSRLANEILENNKKL